MTAPERRADLLIQGGTAMTPNGREGIDIACRDGKIVGLGDLRAWTAAETFDARGLHILPGVIDSQVHFREPGLTHKEDIESGTRGAVLGGVTGVFEMPNTNPLTLTAADLNAKLASAAHSAWCEHAFYIGGSAVNAEHLAELENLPGCSGVKVFMGSSFGDLLADDDGVVVERRAGGVEDRARRGQDLRTDAVAGGDGDRGEGRGRTAGLIGTGGVDRSHGRLMNPELLFVNFDSQNR